jgi:hypothetical protein
MRQGSDRLGQISLRPENDSATAARGAERQEAHQSYRRLELQLIPSHDDK